MTCVVEIFTTAGSSRSTIAPKVLDKDTGFGRSRSVAPLGRIAWVAFTRPEITVPIKMPIASVAATSRVAANLRSRAQAPISRSWIPIIAPVGRGVPAQIGCRIITSVHAARAKWKGLTSLGANTAKPRSVGASRGAAALC